MTTPCVTVLELNVVVDCGEELLWLLRLQVLTELAVCFNACEKAPELEMGVYLSTPKTEKASEDGENDRLRYGLSSMQGWRTTMEDAHAAHTDLDDSTSFFGVYDGHGGKAVAKFCAKYLHQQMLKHEAYLAGDIGTSLKKSFLRMDEMMCGQRGWRELAVLGEKTKKFSGMREWFIWSPKSGAVSGHVDDWAFEEDAHYVTIRHELRMIKGPIVVSGDQMPDAQLVLQSSKATSLLLQMLVILVVFYQGTARLDLPESSVSLPLSSHSMSVTHPDFKAHILTKDHKPDLEVEKDRILKAGGFVRFGRVNGSLNLARAIGDIEFKENKHLPAEKQIITADPDITSVELCSDDEFLVIACDGIWDCMSSQQLVDFVHEQLKTENKLKVICERVFDWCLAPTAGGLGCDNMTMILIQFKRPSNPDASVMDQ
ncbi:putative protein phosphatase 2C 60 [Senna tora]|uniref:protein-serine/threonine phosphatase n=1 Tax=Senna tora TaxID=362788 RepID=A0A834WAS5_9FABA|nr:putative protein phosphatase 2C 60 [Senna tora]